MTINNQIEALSIKNTMVKPVNMTEFNNPFLLLSSTKALNELVVNTNPSSRAKVANIEPTKSKFQQNPLGVPIDVYTKDTPTTPQVPKINNSAKKARIQKKIKSELGEKIDKLQNMRKARAAAKEKSDALAKAKEAKERKSMGANDINIRKPGRPDQGVNRQKKEVAAAKAAAKAAEQQAKQKAQEAKQALQSAAKPASQSKKKRKKTTKKDPHKGL